MIEVAGCQVVRVRRCIASSCHNAAGRAVRPNEDDVWSWNTWGPKVFAIDQTALRLPIPEQQP